MKHPLFSLVLGVTLSASAFTDGLDISPNPDGSFDILFELDWEYDGPLYSGVALEYSNVLSDDEQPESYVSLSGRELTAAVDVLAFRFGGDGLQTDLGLNLLWSRSILREIGYIDSGGTRFFVLNDRTISLLLPRVLAAARIPIGPARLSAQGELSPAFVVGLSQNLTISPGFPATPFESRQLGNLAFSVNSQVRAPGNLVTLEAAAEFDHVPIQYDVLTAGGPATVSVFMQNLSVSGSAVISAIELDGLSPAFTVSYSWNWTTDPAAGTPPVLDSSVDFAFGFDL